MLNTKYLEKNYKHELMEEYKFDSTAFNVSTAEEADQDMRNYKNLTPKQRLKIAVLLAQHTILI